MARVTRDTGPVLADVEPILLCGDQAANATPIAFRKITREITDRWCKLVGNRRLWADAGINSETMSRDCGQLLHDLGVPEENLRQLAQGEFLEVAIPYHTEKDSLYARCFPWEFVLAKATKGLRGDKKPLIVVRHLSDRKKEAAPEPAPPGAFAFIESAPKPFDQFYGFSAERDLLRDAVKPIPCHDFYNPTRRQLEEFIAEKKSQVIHLTGLDRHQGVSLLRWKGWERDSKLVKDYASVQEPADGLVVLNDRLQLDFLDAPTLARSLTANEVKPTLVTMNLYHSAASLAAMTVAEGAGAAIGFQDHFDDSLCDTFFWNLYRALVRVNWKILPAFVWTVRSLPRTALSGTGIVLWSRQAWLGKTE